MLKLEISSIAPLSMMMVGVPDMAMRMSVLGMPAMTVRMKVVMPLLALVV